MKSQELIFLSYSRRDASIIRKLRLIIKASGAKPFRDEDDIEPGRRWRIVITETIVRCDRFLLFWCSHSKNSDAVQDELRLATNEDKMLVPVQLDRTKLPRELSEIQAIDVSDIVWWRHQRINWERIVWLLGFSLIVGGAMFHLL